jgi:ABC-type multidrug transport system fused ATPase/permease subunit
MDDLRNRIVVIPQEGFLFDGTIRDNLRIAKPDATEDELLIALDKIGLRERFEALPEGLDTEVRERGSRLSAGERQLVALSRAALIDPAVLVLDEATSALDSTNEQAIQQALREAAAQRTTLVIAHRLSTVVDANMIIVLEQGQIVQSGTHDELLSQGGRYAELWAMQARESTDC